MTSRYTLSDHHDGRRFFNPGRQPRSRSLLEVLRWRLANPAPPLPPPPRGPGYPLPQGVVRRGQAALTFINHSTFLLQLPGAVLLTDPIFSRRCSPVPWAGPKRVRPPGLSLDRLPAVDVVLLSHCHYDHMDLPSLRALQHRCEPRFVTLLGDARRLRRLGIRAIELDWWQSVWVDGLRITATPARHFSARTPFDRNRSLWGGFMIADPGGQVLFAGDSGTGPHWSEIRDRLGTPDLALLPIGAYEPRRLMAPVHMNPAEAVQAHLALGARRSVGMHFGTFPLAGEAMDAPERELAAARTAANLEAGQFLTLGFGETRLFGLRRGRPEAPPPG